MSNGRAMKEGGSSLVILMCTPDCPTQVGPAPAPPQTAKGNEVRFHFGPG